jgi:1-deoxy-D-xylulose-5-phosphate synthase
MLPVGKGEVRRESTARGGSGKVAILAFGSMVHPSLKAAETLDATVANMRFVKPLDVDLIIDLAGRHDLLVTVEENVIAGGAGSAVLEALERATVAIPVLQLGLPDRFIDQGDPAIQLNECGLTAEGILQSIRARLAQSVSPVPQEAIR